MTTIEHAPADPGAGAAPATVAGRGRNAAEHLDRAYSIHPGATTFTGFGRNVLYLAMNPDPAKRGGLPFLASFKVGGRRLIRGRALVAWLDELEAAARVEPKDGRAAR